jgi:hypothetical protein
MYARNVSPCLNPRRVSVKIEHLADGPKVRACLVAKVVPHCLAIAPEVSEEVDASAVGAGPAVGRPFACVCPRALEPVLNAIELDGVER